MSTPTLKKDGTLDGSPARRHARKTAEYIVFFVLVAAVLVTTVVFLGERASRTNVCADTRGAQHTTQC